MHGRVIWLQPPSVIPNSSPVILDSPPPVILDIFNRESSVFALRSVVVVGRMSVASSNLQARMRAA